MKKKLELIEALKPIDQKLINELNKLASNKVEYWDLRCGLSIGTTLDFTNHKSKEISSYESTGCGIRTFINGGWGFIALKDFTRNAIVNGFSKALKLATLSESLCKNKFKINERDPLIKDFHVKSKKKIENIDVKEKIDLVKHHEKIASSYSSKITNTRTYYIDECSYNLFLNSFGSYIYQDLPVLKLFCLSYAKDNGLLQRARNSVGGIGGFEITETNQAENLSLKSAKEAVELLHAVSPKGGKMTVIMDPKFTGVCVHEAFGHACEADFILNKESILEGKVGKKVAGEEVSIIDDPTMGQGKKHGLPYELYGSYHVDDEGVPSQRTVLIENGLLKNYLHNIETASRMDIPPNGHGRASSHCSRPLVRMGITVLEPRDWNLEEMIEDTKNGILCEDFQYGYTDPTTGNFQFKCKMSYKIENGEKKELMRDVSLSGMILEILNKISAIGNNVYFSDGTCGKGGQGVPVCDGGPFIRVNDVVVGGLN